MNDFDHMPSGHDHGRCPFDRPAIVLFEQNYLGATIYDGLAIDGVCFNGLVAGDHNPFLFCAALYPNRIGGHIVGEFIRMAHDPKTHVSQQFGHDPIALISVEKELKLRFKQLPYIGRRL